jgi:ribonuclease P protein component
MLKKDTRKTLSKSERLSSKRLIEQLFTNGRSFGHHPFVIRYTPIEDLSTAGNQILISVSKRNFKKAVDRNKLKRQIREAYRLNKAILTDLKNNYAIAYIYTFKKMLPYSELEAKLIESLKRLQKELNTEHEA